MLVDQSADVPVRLHHCGVDRSDDVRPGVNEQISNAYVQRIVR